uniref:ASH1 like histone lysine methyltransferase n=1 Tax=Denticeps clupeoides TaxID=299321 RepID=A0AAY4AK16_9TELE
MDQRKKGGAPSQSHVPLSACPVAPSKNEEGREDTNGKDGSSGDRELAEQQRFSTKRPDLSEGSMKLKVGLGTKRTKKPPKILENYVCRPTTSLRQSRGSRKGGVKNEEVAGANQSGGSMSRNSHTSTSSSWVTSPAAPNTSVAVPEAPVSRTGKRAPPKLAQKAEMKSELFLETNQIDINNKKLSSDGKTRVSTPCKQTLSPTPAASPPSSSEQHSGTHEGSKVISEEAQQVNNGGKSGNAEMIPKELPHAKHLKKASKLHTVSVSEAGNRGARPHVNPAPPYPVSTMEKICPVGSNQTEDVHKKLPSSPGDIGTISDNKMNETSNNRTSPSHSNILTSVENEKSKKSTMGKICPHDPSPKSSLNVNQSVGQVPVQRGETTPSPSTLSSQITVNVPDTNIALNQEKEAKCIDSSREFGSEQNKLNQGTKGFSGGQIRKRMNQTDSQDVSTSEPDKPVKKRKRERCSRLTQGKDPNASSRCSMLVPKPLKTRRPVGRPPKCNQLLKAQPKKRGRPAEKKHALNPVINTSSHRCTPFLIKSKNEKNGSILSSDKLTNLPKPMQRKRGRPKHSSPSLLLESRGCNATEEAAEDDLDSSSTSNGHQVMKSIIGKINNMRTKRRNWLLNHILSGPGWRDKADSSTGKKIGEVFGSSSSPVHPLPPLAAPFSGNLSSQINISKKGTIYMGKRRGRKPKVSTSSNAHSQSPCSLQSHTVPLKSFPFSTQSAESSSLSPNLLFTEPQITSFINSSKKQLFSNASSSSPHVFQTLGSQGSTFVTVPLKKSLSYNETPNQSHDGKVFPFSSPLPVTSLNEFKDTTSSPGHESHSEETLLCDRGTVMNSTPNWCEKGRCRFGSTTLGVGIGMQQSNVVYSGMTFGINPHQRPSPSIVPHVSSDAFPYTRVHSFRNQSTLISQREKHKHKYKRSVYSCPGYMMKGQKQQCKKKYLQLRGSRQDPDFLTEVEELIVRLSEIHIVHQRSIPEAVLGVDGVADGSRIGISTRSHKLNCVPQNVLPTIFQINFSGYYSPQLAYPYDPLHYVKKPSMKNKIGNVASTDVSVVHGLGFPLSRSGLYHSSHGVPYTSMPLGLSFYKRYPSAETVFPQSEHYPSLISRPSYVHSQHPFHLSNDPTKFHKKKHKLLRQENMGEGERVPMAYPDSNRSSHWVGGLKYKQRHRHHVQEGEDEIGEHLGQPGFGKKVKGQMMDSLTCNRFGLQTSRVTTDLQFTQSSSPSSTSAEKSKFKSATFDCLGTSDPSQLKYREKRCCLQKPWLKSTSFLNSNTSKGLLSRGREDILHGSEEPGRTLRSGRCSYPQSVDTGKDISRDPSSSALKVSGDGLHCNQAHQRPSNRRQHTQQTQSSLHPVTRRHGMWRPSSSSFTNSQALLIQPSPLQTYSQAFDHSYKRNLNHLNRILRAKKIQRQAITGNNMVKKRGPGRPRKHNPPPSKPCHQMPGQKHLVQKRQGFSSLLDVSEAVVLSQNRRGKKPSSTERHDNEGNRPKGCTKDNKFSQKDAWIIRSGSTGGRIKSHWNLASIPTTASDQARPDTQWSVVSAQPPKKKFLMAGLYSDVYKTDDPESQLQQLKKDVLDYIPCKHEYGLLPAPIHVGKYLRLKRIDFQLPYNIQWLWKHNQLGKKPDVPLHKITSNVFVDVKPPPECKAAKCNCTPTDGSKSCVSGCINRQHFLECSPGVCPSGPQCDNQHIQRRQWVRGLKPCWSESSGWGLCSTEALHAGQFIIEYVGEVVSPQEFRRRAAQHRYEQDAQRYLRVSSDIVIDSHHMGNKACFVKQSPEPNCELQKWLVNGIFRIGLFALKDLSRGTELTCSYAVCSSTDTQKVCECDSDQSVGLSKGQEKPVGGDVCGVETQEASPDVKVSLFLKMKPFSRRERDFVQKHSIFLVRNYESMRKKLWRDGEAEQENMGEKQEGDKFSPTSIPCEASKSDIFTQSEDAETDHLISVLKDICDLVTQYKDSAGHVLAAPLLNLRSRKRKLRSTGSDPLDLTTIKRKILSGHYKCQEAFDKDMLQVFLSAEKYYGKKSSVGRDVCRLRKVYHLTRRNAAAHNPIVLECDPGEGRSPGGHEEMVQNEKDTPHCSLSRGQQDSGDFATTVVLKTEMDRMEAQKKRLDIIVLSLLQHKPSKNMMPHNSVPEPHHQPFLSNCGQSGKKTREEAKRTEG